MGHGKARKENDCLNCGTIVSGRYCPACGQENIEPKETLWSMFVHFFTDITHFDGKFFKTLGILFTKPGLLSLEYVKGRRMKYLNPIRMYVFTSWLFFSLFFLFVTLPDSMPGSPVNLTSAYNTALENADNAADSVAIHAAFKPFLKDSDQEIVTDSIGGVSTSDSERFSLNELFASLEADGVYESGSSTNWLTNSWQGKLSEKDFWVKAAEKFVHSFPYMLFVSLPLYALYLYLLYWRRRKQFYYADHGLFLIHLYIFTFIWMLLFALLLYAIQHSTAISLLVGWTLTGMIIYGVYYAYKSMRAFYGQGRFKTLTKFIVFNTLCFISIMILFLVFFGISAYRVME